MVINFRYFVAIRYLTENGIYGEEEAIVDGENGTNAKGYYEYTGDDGHLYRVQYKSGEEGFIPKGEHIPTPPPIPDAIARALKYVEDQIKANGNRPLFDDRGFPIKSDTNDEKEKPKDKRAAVTAEKAEAEKKSESAVKEEEKDLKKIDEPGIQISKESQ